MNDINTTPSTKIISRLFLTRIGKICSNISIVFLLLCLSAVLSFVTTAYIFILGLCVIILSIGTIFIAVPNFFDILMSGVEFSAKISEFFLQYWYIFVSFTILFSVVSLILLATDKTSNNVARIVISSVVLFFAFVVVIVLLLGV